MNTHRYPKRTKTHRNERMIGDGPGKPPNMPFGAARGLAEVAQTESPAAGRP